jgi:hypothetical protein
MVREKRSSSILNCRLAGDDDDNISFFINNCLALVQTISSIRINPRPHILILTGLRVDAICRFRVFVIFLPLTNDVIRIVIVIISIKKGDRNMLLIDDEKKKNNIPSEHASQFYFHYC